MDALVSCFQAGYLVPDRESSKPKLMTSVGAMSSLQ